MLRALRPASRRYALLIGLGLVLTLAGAAPPAPANESMSAAEIATGLGMTAAEFEAAAGASLTEVDDRLRALDRSSRFGDYSGGNLLNLTSVGAHDRAGGGLTCTGYGERGAPGAGNNTWNVYGRHRVDCPPLVTSSWCDVKIYFPNNPEYHATQNSASGDDDCDVRAHGSGYGWNLSGNMRGIWAATATAFWVNTHPASCMTSQFTIICSFHTDFKIPGYGYPWDYFNWAPSGQGW
jgi:hypothetical protein